MPNQSLIQEAEGGTGHAQLPWKHAVSRAIGSNVANLASGAPDNILGITLTAGDRILVYGQSTATQNGIYYVSVLGTGADGTWLRDTDCDSTADLAAGLLVYVKDGAQAGKIFKLTNSTPPVLDTNDLTFEATLVGDSVAVGGVTNTGFTDLSGGIKLNREATAVGVTVYTSTCVYSVTDTSAARTIQLQAASGYSSGFIIIVKDASGAAATNNITVDADGSDTIDGAGTYVINTNFGSVVLMCTGASGTWEVVSKHSIGNVGVLSTTVGIDGKSATTTNLYTVPTGRTAVITEAIIRVTTATSITVTGTAGIGVAAGEVDIFPSTALTGLTATGLCFRFDNVNSTYVTVAAASVIKLGIDVGYTATTATLAVDLIGYLI